jgi:hypothetical protein
MIRDPVGLDQDVLGVIGHGHYLRSLFLQFLSEFTPFTQAHRLRRRFSVAIGAPPG